MDVQRVKVVLLAVVLFAAWGASVLAAPGASRLPWDDVQELLRLEVMGPGVEAPLKEYILSATEPIGANEQAQLAELGIELVSVRGEAAVVRGRLTAFSELYGAGDAFGWVRSVLPHLPIDYSSSAEYYSIGIDYALSNCSVEDMPANAGAGLLIAVIDGGFTGALEDMLGSDQVHYLQMQVSGDTNDMELVAGRKDGQHGTMCAEAVAAMVPKADFLLFSAPDFLSRLEIMRLIAEGNVIQAGGRTINLSHIDLISDSTYYAVPLDHNDGRGDLATSADAIVEEGIPYIYALGNFGRGEDTDRAFFAAEYEDADDNLFHDFDPESDTISDQDSLAITVEPREDDEPMRMTVILEWDGWPYQIDTGASAWTRDEITSIQDIDLYIYYQDSDTGSVSQVALSERNQLEALYLDGALSPIEPLEIAQFQVEEPGTYLIAVHNATSRHRLSLETRDVDFHLYVHASGGQFSMEHSTADGALVNVGGAQDVICVGAVGFTLDETWCLMDYSSRGPTSDGRLKPELVAPTMYKSEVEDRVFTGTSASAPLVAGIAAWLLDEVPQATPAQLREALCQTAQSLTGTCNRAPAPGDCGFCSQSCNYGVGCGLVDGVAALTYLRAIVD